MTEASHKVFVYGTLKQGEPNQHWLTNEGHGLARFISQATTTVKYPLVIASNYNIPFLLDKPGTGQIVKGEIYEVDNKMLQNLDILEDHPKWYIRETRAFKLNIHSESQVHAWVYLLKTFRDSLLQLPFYEEYRSKGPHGLIYCEPSERDPTYDACADVQGVFTETSK